MRPDPKPRGGYYTQCDTGGNAPLRTPCPAKTKLDKPARWRCAGCVAQYGPLPERKP